MAEELPEELKNLSPEELQQLQKQQCLFCAIVSGKVQSKKIYEDDRVIAILDINPAAPGHILVLPKEHVSIMPQLGDDDTAYLFAVVKALSQTALQTLAVKGTTIFVANGIPAGQRTSHLLVHIIPRTEGDNVGIQIPERKLSDADMAALQKQLLPFVRKAFGEARGSEAVSQGKSAETESASSEPQTPLSEKTSKPANQPNKPPNQPTSKPKVDLDSIAELLGGK